MFFLTICAGAGLAQMNSDGLARSASAASQLSASPTRLTYRINLEKETVKVKHFTASNDGDQPLQITVNAPTDPHYVITAPPQLSPFGGAFTLAAKTEHSTANKVTVDVAFAPAGAGPAPNATILVGADGTTGTFSDNQPERQRQPPGARRVGGGTSNTSRNFRERP